MDRVIIINGKPMEEWERLAWANVPQDLKDRMLTVFSPEQASELLEAVEGDHMFLGMSVRNKFRTAIKDAELPPFDAYYGEGTDVRNWDDYYVSALKYIAGAIK